MVFEVWLAALMGSTDVFLSGPGTITVPQCYSLIHASHFSRSLVRVRRGCTQCSFWLVNNLNLYLVEYLTFISVSQVNQLSTCTACLSWILGTSILSTHNRQYPLFKVDLQSQTSKKRKKNTFNLVFSLSFSQRLSFIIHIIAIEPLNNIYILSKTKHHQ